MKRKLATKKLIGKFPRTRCQWGNGLGGFEIVRDGKQLGFGRTKEEAWLDAARKNLKQISNWLIQ